MSDYPGRGGDGKIQQVSSPRESAGLYTATYQTKEQ